MAGTGLARRSAALTGSALLLAVPAPALASPLAASPTAHPAGTGLASRFPTSTLPTSTLLTSTLATSTSAAGTDPVGGPALGTSGTVRSAGTAALPATTARSFLVADLDSGLVLAARAPHRRLRPASTLKLLLVAALMPRLDPRAVHVGTPEDAALIGSRVGITPGLRYTVGDLWHGVLLGSGNDAAHALADLAGGVPQTVALMNASARRLGATDTTAVTPEGLDADGQLSSAYDLALLGRDVLSRPDVRGYAGAPTYELPGRDGRRYQIRNENRLLGKDGVYAGKNGYTTLAGNTYVGAAERDGHRLVVVVLHPKHGRVYPEAAALLAWGSRATAAGVPGVGELVAPGTSTGAAADPAVAGRDHPEAAGILGPAGVAVGVLTRKRALGEPVEVTLVTIAALGLVLAALRTRAVVRRRRRRAGRVPAPRVPASLNPAAATAAGHPAPAAPGSPAPAQPAAAGAASRAPNT